ncbi:carbohydrate kinase [Niabella sp. CC-SYL272]|uniref:carbohydrate kinase family protein n=1 Tax=Niabella agricola TaxID=2891571 RepID=UPI001F2EC008|nr:carbohydrate kinase [Niabella agricola]MCF3108841.1 carbohydrate kinase [Niabella agricola]
MTNKNNGIVCFGELLWDVLPDRELPGGAPMNVAYHLSKLGHPTTLISRLGNDEHGRRLRAILNNRQIDTSLVQTDAHYKTSVVLATPNEAGDMKYQIVENVAWDFIELEPLHAARIANARYFVFGSLATRNKVSQDTLFQLMDIPCRKVLDINLRAPFIYKERLEYQLHKTQVLKMNEEELNLVTGWYSRLSRIEDRMQLLQDRFHIETLIVTRGAKGAIVNYNNRFYAHDGFTVKVADTIGSGDSFLAGFLSKFIAGSSIDVALTFACSVGAFIATREGGCPDYDVGEITAAFNTITTSKEKI